MPYLPGNQFPARLSEDPGNRVQLSLDPSTSSLPRLALTQLACRAAGIFQGLRGMASLQGMSHTRPPMTLPMLSTLLLYLNPSDPFDACIGAISRCAFFGLMRFGEVSVPSCTAFSEAMHLKRSDVLFANNLDGRPYARLRLPAAKTTCAGKTQDIFLVEESGLFCPLAALRNLTEIVPAGPSDPLFSWRDTRGTVRPMVSSAALLRINSILSAQGWENTLGGHSFRTGGTSFYLGKGIDPEIVRIHSRRHSLACELYVHGFEQVATRHLANLA